jgi:hypothetical protein
MSLKLLVRKVALSPTEPDLQVPDDLTELHELTALDDAPEA